MGPNESKLIQMCLSLKLLSGHFEFVTVYLGLVFSFFSQTRFSCHSSFDTVWVLLQLEYCHNYSFVTILLLLQFQLKKNKFCYDFGFVTILVLSYLKIITIKVCPIFNQKKPICNNFYCEKLLFAKDFQIICPMGRFFL